VLRIYMSKDYWNEGRKEEIELMKDLANR
jgi:hypothetical protein